MAATIEETIKETALTAELLAQGLGHPRYNQVQQPPRLDRDFKLKNEFGVNVHPTGKLERRIVWNLLLHLEQKGFFVTDVDDGDQKPVSVNGPKQAMEVIFNLDDCWIRVENLTHGSTHLIRLVLGNECDLISDYTFKTPDADGFQAAMCDFKPESCL